MENWFKPAVLHTHTHEKILCHILFIAEEHTLTHTNDWDVKKKNLFWIIFPIKEQLKWKFQDV